MTSPYSRLYPERLQEWCAGFLDHTDDYLGRLIDAIASIQLGDNTLIPLVSDNGASQVLRRDGTANTD
jgi:arylsulfatase